MDDARVRFLQNRVLTATPGQRIVMLFDRLVLDLTRATMADSVELRQHTGHASQILAELFGSLDPTAGGPADNLAAIYGFLLKELMIVDSAVLAAKIPALLEIVTGLRSAWVGAVEQLGTAGAAGVSDRPGPSSGADATDSGPRALVGSWVG